MKNLSSTFAVVFMMLFSIPASAQVSDWEYKGIQSRGTMAEAITAEASVNQSRMELVYFTRGKKLYLWFTYDNPERDLHPGYDAYAEMFIRTREGLDRSGRYDSDYLVKGEITVDHGVKGIEGLPQYITATLTDEDLDALMANEKNGVMGAGYFTQDEIFHTTTFPTRGFTAAAKRILREIAEIRGAAPDAPTVQPQPKYSATAEDEAMFTHCADLYSQVAIYKASWENYKAQEPAMLSTQSDLQSALADDEGEVMRLKKILQIMKNSDEVWAKYHRAYDQYKRTHDAFEEFDQDAGALFERANGDRQKSLRAWDRITNECPEELNTQFLQTKCSPGSDKFRAICSAYGQ